MPGAYSLSLVPDFGVGNLGGRASEQFRTAEEGEVLRHFVVHLTLHRLHMSKRTRNASAPLSSSKGFLTQELRCKFEGRMQ